MSKQDLKGILSVFAIMVITVTTMHIFYLIGKRVASTSDTPAVIKSINYDNGTPADTIWTWKELK